MIKKIFTIYEINKYVKDILKNDVLLSDVFVEGEISNLKVHISKHIYFTLKDFNACINCIMFSQNANELKFYPENGMKVIVYGKVSLYEKTGQYQLYIDIMEPFGKGSLYIYFEQLKSKLKAEGLFDKDIKKDLPSNPKTIALITSPTGAVVHDMIKISKRRNKSVSLVVIPVLVQGNDAAKSIAEGIELANKWNKADIIIVGRGGGSIEDLWAFNEEIVARAIYCSNTPVVSAVGHETDFTISDFVADVRASTPSAAIEMCVPDLSNLKYMLDEYKKKLSNILQNKYTQNKYILNKIINNPFFLNPNKLLYSKKSYFNNILNLLDKETNLFIEKENIKLENLITILKSVSPLNVLKRGYTIVYKDELPIKDVKKLNLGDEITIKFSENIIKANVKDIKKIKEGSF